VQYHRVGLCHRLGHQCGGIAGQLPSSEQSGSVTINTTREHVFNPNHDETTNVRFIAFDHDYNADIPSCVYDGNGRLVVWTWYIDSPDMMELVHEGIQYGYLVESGNAVLPLVYDNGAGVYPYPHNTNI